MIRRAKQFSVCLPNKPGAGAKFFSALGKTNLMAVSVVDSVDCSTVRLVPSNATQAAKVLAKARICSTTQPVLVRYCQKLWMTGAKARRILGACSSTNFQQGKDTPHATEYYNGHGFDNGFFRPGGQGRTDRDSPTWSSANVGHSNRERGS